jgi:hypothetical protein
MFEGGIEGVLSFDQAKKYKQQAEDCLQRASDSTEAPERQLWNAFALEFLSLAAAERNLRN